MKKLPKIVIVEDDIAISQMYRIKFEVEGFEIETADNGRLGLELIEKSKPDIVLLDLMMPEMNGDEVLEKLRSQPWGKNLPVIILTNLGQQEAPVKLDNLNVDYYIVKAEMTPKQVAEIVKARLKANTT